MQLSNMRLNDINVLIELGFEYHEGSYSDGYVTITPVQTGFDIQVTSKDCCHCLTFIEVLNVLDAIAV